MRVRLVLLVAMAWACAPLAQDQVGVGQRSLYHGRLNLSAGSHRAFDAECFSGDSILGGLRVLSGGQAYIFWADEDNYKKWASGDPSAELHDYQEGENLELAAEVSRDGRYYVVVGSGAGARLDLRLKVKREEGE